MPIDERPVVYSTDPDFDPQKLKESKKVRSLPPQMQTAALYLERKGRGGKTVTVVRELILSDDDLKSLSKILKQLCGTGGTVKAGTIEIQGDHREKIAIKMKTLGYKTKLVGG